ncbi:hypothetical protein RHSIM_Rhsim03G0071600 [Rhododendron simsii]|uniref:F-box domain-containing protein n=1 Tax=Rhododendron simsii TaxID=118357 RepID=A0A834LSR4_RHOSS|nr:hypothetical protein RHSIM_Rhsim03G0071600 [Rhododendron simsii]
MCNKKRTLRFCSGNTRGITNEGYLPREIWVDILTRLPAKMVGQCKCICKHWRALIEEPSFVELHHFRSKSRPGGCYLVISSYTRDKKDTIFFSADYEGGLAGHLFSHLVSGSLSWRKIDIVPPASHFEFGGDGICHGGVIHGRNFSSESFRIVHDEVVVTFDLKDERFGVISLPRGPSCMPRLFQLGGHLAACEDIPENEVEELWILVDYDNWVWVKERIMLPPDFLGPDRCIQTNGSIQTGLDWTDDALDGLVRLESLDMGLAA